MITIGTDSILKMLRLLVVVAAILSLASGVSQSQPGQVPAEGVSADQMLLEKAAELMGEESALYIENRGQWESEVSYLVETGGLNTWITRDGVVYDLFEHVEGEEEGAEDVGKDNEGIGRDDREGLEGRRGHVVRMRYLGGESTSRVVGVDQASGEWNYLLGKDESRWARGVRRYGRVRVEELYAGVDVVYYVEGGRPRYDLVVGSGVDPSVIRMSYEGAEGLEVGSSGELRIETSLGAIEQRGLYAYQEIGGERREVSCGFEVDGSGRVGFKLGAYDRSRALVIDPLVWSTVVGGNLIDDCSGIAVDGEGNAYVTGYAYSSVYPTTTGAYDESHNGETDIFITKLSSDGSRLLYSTFIGGTLNDYGSGIAVDGEGNAYVTGYTNSSDYPTTGGAYDESHNGKDDIFITKLSSDGRRLLYSTLVGGPSFDQCLGLAVDVDGNAYVTGSTDGSDYPTTGGAYDELYNGGADIFITKLSSDGSQLLYSTLVGGKENDFGFGLTVDVDGNAYVTGYTHSSDYPTTSGAYDESYNGEGDIFITKLSSDGRRLLYSTLVGGLSFDQGRGIAVDGEGNAYVTGYTNSSDYPTTSGAYDESHNGGADLIITKLSSDGSRLLYSTFIGGTLSDIGLSLAVDVDGNAYVTGTTDGSGYPTTSGAYDESHNGGTDLIITKLSSDGRQLLYSTLVGGQSSDQGWGIAVDSEGNASVAGTTRSSGYPTTVGAYDESHNGLSDITVSKIAIPSIHLLSPDQEVTLCGGATEEIRWNSLSVEKVKIDLSTDGGATWSPVVESTSGSLGSYSWTVPSVATTEARIRVMSVLSEVVVDISQENFSIATIEITKHPANQTVIGGGQVSFTAGAAGNPSVQWQRSSDGGSSWADIPGATTDSYSFVATVKEIATEYRAVYDDGNCQRATTSASLQVIVNLGVARPNGSEVWCGNTKQVIEWEAIGISSVKIEYTIDGGTTWKVIENSVSSTGLYEWRVSPDQSRLARIRLSATENEVVNDESDGNFTISTVVLTSEPLDQDVEEGGRAEFSAMASSIPSPTVQWQVKERGSSQWKDIEGATSEEYGFTVRAADHLNEYRAVFDNGACQEMSGSGVLRVSGVSQVDFGGEEALGSVIIPNPVTGDYVRVELESGLQDEELSLRVYDKLGEEVVRPVEFVKESGSKLSGRIDVTGLPTGDYLVVVRRGSKVETLPMRILRKGE
ncbi:MAG: SBBP repeat-containing protein [Ignavibacteriae bacterium]|nr:SBBP repeat-containing protein [Ignavibacteriota bacterium]MCB9215977.1 SBBP repeat-containing protein [Ignavibacteria bacterium]